MDEFKYGVGDIVTWVDTFYGKPLISDSLYKVRGVYKVAHSTGAYYCLDKVCGASDELSEGQTGWLYEEKNLFPSEREAALFCALTCGVFNHVIDGPCCSGPDARRYSTGDKVFIIDKVGNEWVASHVMCEVKLVGEGNRYTIAPSDSAFKECPEEQISLLKRVLSGLRYPESQVFKTFKEAAYACIALNQKPKENKDEQLADNDNKNRKPRFQKGDKVHALYFQGGKWSYSIQRFTVDGVEKTSSGHYSYKITRDGERPWLTGYSEADLYSDVREAYNECEERNFISGVHDETEIKGGNRRAAPSPIFKIGDEVYILYQKDEKWFCSENLYVVENAGIDDCYAGFAYDFRHKSENDDDLICIPEANVFSNYDHAKEVCAKRNRPSGRGYHECKSALRPGV